ncbi:MAG: tetratricopeptide repeat protein, partial [Planctomycetota bacterium]
IPSPSFSAVPRTEDFQPLPSLEQILAKKDSFSLLQALTAFSKELDPSFNPYSFAKDFFQLSEKLKKRIEGKKKDGKIIKTLNSFIFAELGFQPDSSPDKQHQIQNLMIHKILESKKAYCLGLSALYLLFSEILNLPIYGVSVPGHFFVRYERENFSQNIETTQKGKSLSDSYYIKKYKISDDLLDRGVYLSNLEPKEVVVEFLNNRGNYFYRLGNLEKAEADFNLALAHSLNFIPAYGSKGFIALRKGALKEARNYFKEALEINPFYGMALLGMGEIYLKLNHLKKAEEYFQRLVELEPENPLGLTNLGLIYGRKGHLDKALELHQKAVYYDTQCLYAYNNLAATYYRMGKTEEAIATFQFILKQNPQFFPALHNIILALEKSGLTERARKQKKELIEYYRSLLKDSPKEDRYYYELARLVREENIGEALQLIQQALGLRPYFPDYVEFLAETYALKGDTIKARETLRFFLENSGQAYLYNEKRIEKSIQKYYELEKEGKKLTSSLKDFEEELS